MPISFAASVLLFFQLLLFVLYALPPFRFKERGILGIFSDALYAHALPALLASLTFIAFIPNLKNHHYVVLLLLGVWQFALGLRNILLHQIADANNDRRANTHTWVTQNGEHIAQKWLFRWLLPTEFAFFIVYCMAICSYFPYFALSCSIFFLYLFVQQKHNAHQTNANTNTTRNEQKQAINTYKIHKFIHYSNDFYLYWLPIAVLVGAIAAKWHPAWAILFLHSMVFRSASTLLLNELRIAALKLLAWTMNCYRQRRK